MDTDPVVGPLAEQLLGEIETRIVGMQYYDVTVRPGEQVNLEREPDTQYVRQKALDYVELAKDELTTAPRNPARQTLVDLADFVVTRRY